jgi:signal peptidase I
MDIWGLLFALFVRTFIFQPFTTPSGSMLPTLEIGDTFIASKYAYGYSRYALPPFIYRGVAFLPEGRILSFAPKRGDVIIFKLPRDPQTDYVKRVIGLPGDRIQMIGGRLYINGAIVEREPIAPYTIAGTLGKPLDAARYIETLPGGSRHEIIEIEGDKGFLANTPVFETPPGNYFAMGDNRDNSTDSRIPPEKGGVGFVPRDDLVARAERVIFPAGDNASRLLLAIH